MVALSDQLSAISQTGRVALPVSRSPIAARSRLADCIVRHRQLLSSYVKLA
jgi:hypothetical protein